MGKKKGKGGKKDAEPKQATPKKKKGGKGK
jgi:hypothetical protein